MFIVTQIQMDALEERALDAFALKVQQMLERDFNEDLAMLGKDDGQLQTFIKQRIIQGEDLGLESDAHRGAFAVLSVFRVSKKISDRTFGIMKDQMAAKPDRVMAFINQF